MPTFVHQELHTTDTGAAKEFYGKVFGWSFQDMPMPNGVYTMLADKDGGFGGLVEVMPEGKPGWLAYAGVEDLDASLALVAEAGGNILMPKQHVEGNGWMAWIADPQGNVMGLWQDENPPAPEPEPEPAPAPKPKKKATKKKATKKKATKKKATKKKATKKKATKKKATKKKATKKKATKKKATKKKAAKKK